MSTLTKKIFVSALAAVMIAGVAGPGVAQGQTVEELQAQIQSLLSTISQLQAQISSLGGSSTGGGVAGIPAGFTFTRNLSNGSSGTDVMYLQMLLNSNAATQVATTGVGSPGQETQFFGPLTANAVSRFQNTYASEVLTPLGLTSGTGFFGASSRAKANALVASGTGTGGTTGGGTTGGGITTPGAEGSLIVTIASDPASGTVLNTSQSKEVTGVDIKATGSDIEVDRLDLQFDTRPWQYIAELTVSDGTNSKTVAVTQSNSIEVTVGTTYYVRVDGLNMVIPKDTTKTVTVTAKAVAGLPVGTTTKNIVLTFIANSLRGTDGAGLTQTAPTASIATRTITVQEPSAAAIEITAAADNPKARAVIVNSTADTTGVVVAKINVKAKNNDVILRTVEFDDTDIAAASSQLKTVFLYDGDTLLASTGSLTTASSVLSNIDLLIPKDTTKTLTVKATVHQTSGKYLEGATSTMVFEANATGFAAEDATSFADATVSGSTVAPGAAYFYTKAPKIALASKSISGVESGTASSSPQALDGQYVLSVTAEGGDIYIPISSSNSAASSGILVATSTNLGNSNALTATFTSSAAFGSSANDTYVVRSGTTETFTVTGNISACGGSADTDTSAFVGLVTTNIKWGTTVATAQQPANTWTWGLTDFKSGEAYLPACS
jgi:hypothetical protein